MSGKSLKVVDFLVFAQLVRRQTEDRNQLNNNQKMDELEGNF